MTWKQGGICWSVQQYMTRNQNSWILPWCKFKSNTPDINDLKQKLRTKFGEKQWTKKGTPCVTLFRKYLGVSKNRGTPKSSILIRFSIINHPFWGTPIFGNTHLFILCIFHRLTALPLGKSGESFLAAKPSQGVYPFPNLQHLKMPITPKKHPKQQQSEATSSLFRLLPSKQNTSQTKRKNLYFSQSPTFKQLGKLWQKQIFPTSTFSPSPWFSWRHFFPPRRPAF